MALNLKSEKDCVDLGEVQGALKVASKNAGSNLEDARAH